MPPRDRLLAALVAVLWGANFLAIHVGLQHFPPLYLAASPVRRPRRWSRCC